MMRSSVVVGLVLVVGGCVAGVGDEATSTTEQGLKCPNFGCGENSPVTGPFNINELKENVANRDGVVLLYFQKGTTKYHVKVLGDRIQAMDWTTNHTVMLEHNALAGGWLQLSHPPVNGMPFGYVRLWIQSVDVAGQTFWQPPAAQVETYEFRYDGAGTVSDPVPACKSPLPSNGVRDEAADGEGRTWKNRFNSIVFSGDRYDPDTYSVFTGTPTNGWMNIACAGSAPAKLHLNRHTQAGTVTSFQTTVNQRQAMLKMYAGDFCGHGNVYTVMGTKIHWNSSTGYNSGLGNDTAFESMWSETGAMCLETHRLANSQNPDYAAFGAAIRAECGLKLCSDFRDFKNYAAYGQYLMTLSPQ